MSGEREQVVVVPCSGIGKTYGTVSREAAYDLCEDLRPDDTQLIALAKLVLGEEEARQRVRACPAVTIDGCKLMCASKLVTSSGGTVAHEVAVLDVYRRHKDLKPEGLEELNEAGRRLARFHPTIAVDGCGVRCAARGTEMYSGRPVASVVVDDLLEAAGLPRPVDRRHLDGAGRKAVDLVAERLARLVDEVLDGGRRPAPGGTPGAPAAAGEEATCACRPRRGPSR